MSTDLPDNRMRFPAPPIDFEDDVGDTGQDHDSFPEPGQARYDWMRMAVIALLSNQSSFNEPVNYRVGTPWLDLNTWTLKIRTGDGVKGTEWSDFSEVIQVTDGVTLKSWFEAISSDLADRLVSTEELIAALGHFFTADVSGNITSFVMASPGGVRYKVTMSDTGVLVTTRL
jgi:hypothetical protein